MSTDKGGGCLGLDPVSLLGKAACFRALPFHSFHPWRGQLSHAGVFPGLVRM